jgi:hypothetical protein
VVQEGGEGSEVGGDEGEVVVDKQTNNQTESA